VFRDLGMRGVDILTVGQYLRPSKDHLPIARFYEPEEFTYLREQALRFGFRHVESGPLVRSSYHAHEHADAFRVQRLKRIRGKNAGLLFVDVVREKPACVVAREPHRCLREVVCAIRKELRDLCDFVGEQCGTRQLDHRANKVRQLHAGLLDQFIRYAPGCLLKNRQLFSVEGKRMHDLR